MLKNVNILKFLKLFFIFISQFFFLKKIFFWEKFQHFCENNIISVEPAMVGITVQ